MNLELTETDTKPTPCNFAQDITDCVITINIAYPEPRMKQAVITDAATGAFEFRWAGGDLLPGTWAASITIVDADGCRQNTAPFTISIDRSLT